jgi:hypothetical protein
VANGKDGDDPSCEDSVSVFNRHISNGCYQGHLVKCNDGRDLWIEECSLSRESGIEGLSPLLRKETCKKHYSDGTFDRVYEPFLQTSCLKEDNLKNQHREEEVEQENWEEIVFKIMASLLHLCIWRAGKVTFYFPRSTIILTAYYELRGGNEFLR